MNYYERALELKEEIIANRRYFHINAEVGLHMPKAQAYVMEKLTEYGLKPQICGHGVTAVLGKGGKTLLLRADMDALPMPEESGEPFACPTGTEAHTCGHDFHAAMLLTAAKMLKENEAALNGTIKFMFQPAEETFEGSKDMIAAGLLENPPVDAALAFHVTAGQMPIGIYMYNNKDTMMFSVDGFKITIHGKGSHGAYPQNAVDPIHIGTHIYLALQALIARESNPNDACVLTIGQFCAGTAANIIPDTAVLQGTIRTNKPKARELLVRRMKEVSEKVAEVYGGTVEIEMISEVPPLICDPKLTNQFIEYIKEMNIPGMTEHSGVSSSASEDFAVIAEKIPATFMYLSAGYMDERGAYGAHNPKVRFNEEVCPIGAACYAQCAEKWVNSGLWG
ncbi:MAG: amidohydrolase [Lachnospiraceae bacterium]|nr:amidohydrolase [Lachnospiraceae bacterium]